MVTVHVFRFSERLYVVYQYNLSIISRCGLDRGFSWFFNPKTGNSQNFRHGMCGGGRCPGVGKTDHLVSRFALTILQAILSLAISKSLGTINVLSSLDSWSWRALSAATSTSSHSMRRVENLIHQQILGALQSTTRHYRALQGATDYYRHAQGLLM